jgi:hypothetical protein
LPKYLLPGLSRYSPKPAIGRVAGRPVQLDGLGLTGAGLQHQPPGAGLGRGALQLGQQSAGEAPAAHRGHHEHPLQLGIGGRQSRSGCAQPPPAAGHRHPVEVTDQEEPGRRGELGRLHRGGVGTAVALDVHLLHGGDQRHGVRVPVVDDAHVQRRGTDHPSSRRSSVRNFLPRST